MEKPLSKLSNNLKAVFGSFRVYGKLIARGHIYEEIEGDNFVLQSELTLLGDWQNYISYKGIDKPDQLTLNQLLSDDITLLDQFKEHNQQMLINLQGIKAFPWLIASLLVLGSTGVAWLNCAEEYLLLYEKGLSSISKENLHLLYSPGISVATLVFRKLLIRYVMLVGHYLLRIVNGVKRLFTPKPNRSS